jgi:hypothetical protein
LILLVLLLGGLLLLLVLLFDVLKVSVVSHGLDDSQIVLERSGEEVLIDVLSHLVLEFKFSNVLISLLILFLLLLLAIDLNIKEEVEEGFLLHLLGLLLSSFLFVLLLDDLDGDVLALLPSDRVS